MSAAISTVQPLEMLLPAESLFARLLGQRATDVAAALNDKQSELLLMLLLRNWQVLPTMQRPEADHVLRASLTKADYGTFARAALAIDAFARTQYVVTVPLLAALQKAEVEHCVMKGAACAALLYERPQHRGGWDVDIAVRKGDLGVAEALAIEAGFLRAQQDPVTKRFHAADLSLRSAVESQHYELGFLIRRQFVKNLDDETLDAIRSTPWSSRFWHIDATKGPWCYSAVDIHHGLALDIGLGAVINHAQRITGWATSMSVPSLDWMATILVYKIYWEGVHQFRKGLYQYADLCRLLPWLDDAAYLRFLEHIEELNLIAAAHYVIRRLPAFGLDLMEREEALVELTDAVPDAKPADVNDMGDMWPKLWGRRKLC